MLVSGGTVNHQFSLPLMREDQGTVAFLEQIGTSLRKVAPFIAQWRDTSANPPIRLFALELHFVREAGPACSGAET